MPPGYEDELKPVAMLQRKIEQTPQPLVGLEYTVELTFKYERLPTYNCILCNSRGNEDFIIIHVKGLNHRTKFLVSTIF